MAPVSRRRSRRLRGRQNSRRVRKRSRRIRKQSQRHLMGGGFDEYQTERNALKDALGNSNKLGNTTDLNQMCFNLKGLTLQSGIYHTCRSCNSRVYSKNVGTITYISKFGWLCDTCLKNPDIQSLIMTGSTDRYTGSKSMQSLDSIDLEPDEMQELEDLQKFQETIHRAEHIIQILRAGIEVKQRQHLKLQRDIENHRTSSLKSTSLTQKQCQLRLKKLKKSNLDRITQEIQSMTRNVNHIQDFVSKMKNPLNNGSTQEDKQNIIELKRLLDTIPPIPTHTE